MLMSLSMIWQLFYNFFSTSTKSLHVITWLHESFSCRKTRVLRPRLSALHCAQTQLPRQELLWRSSDAFAFFGTFHWSSNGQLCCPCCPLCRGTAVQAGARVSVPIITAFVSATLCFVRDWGYICTTLWFTKTYTNYKLWVIPVLR